MHINATYYVDNVSMPIVTGFIHIWTIPFKAVKQGRDHERQTVYSQRITLI